MAKIIHKKNTRRIRLLAKIFGMSVSVVGLGIILFFTFPILSWKMFNEPAFAYQEMQSPIPRINVLSKESLRDIVEASIGGTDLTDAANWYPALSDGSSESSVPFYNLTISKIDIKKANVSTVDNNLKEHLVNFRGTAVPPNKGTAVVFGHSTLPQLFNPKDYKTIFAKAHLLKVNDVIEVYVNDVMYKYKIYKVYITTPDDMSVLTQEYDDSYLTIITCTPPGTIWKRLIIQAKLESI